MPLTRSDLLGFHNLLNISDLKDLERKEQKLTSYKKFMDKAEQRLETRDMLVVLITAERKREDACVYGTQRRQRDCVVALLGTFSRLQRDCGTDSGVRSGHRSGNSQKPPDGGIKRQAGFTWAGRLANVPGVSAAVDSLCSPPLTAVRSPSAAVI